MKKELRGVNNLEMVKTLTLILRDLRRSLFLVSLEVNKPEVIKGLMLLVL